MTPLGFAAVAVVAWFAAGTIWNVHLGRSLMRWMQDGLPRLGGRATVRWLGSSAVELAIAEAREPFARATLVIFLEPRDLPWWPLSRLRGRRDTLIVRGALRRAPEPLAEFEALDPQSWSGRDALARVPRAWSRRQGRLDIHYASAAALERAESMAEHAAQAGLALRRLSLRSAEPHFQLHVALPDPGRPAREFFEAVHGLSEIALG